MCCSSTASSSPMAQYLKSRSPEELWKASLKPQDPNKPLDPAQSSNQTGSIEAAKPPGTGLTVDISV
jgi:NifU-like protein involved in Fe-S cluster formation